MPSKYRYGVVLDAGSSGTRVHVYRWLKTAVARAIATKEQLHQLPVIKTKNKKWTKKVHTGISTFASNAQDVGPDHLKGLLDFAMEVVPEAEVSETPIFLLATAGMRMLKESEQKAILAEVCKYAQSKTDFYLPDCDDHIQIIPGETEGLYGWIAANYLVGGFNAPVQHEHPNENHHTYGFLDMGGASAQIAFAPSATETQKHADDLKLLRMRTIDGRASEYQVFVTTFLRYGANEARTRYIESMHKDTSTSSTPNSLPDPCLPTGLSIFPNGTIIPPNTSADAHSSDSLIGSGKFDACLKNTYALLDKDAACPNEPCLFHGIHAPAIDFSINHFIGVSNFWHGTHEIFNMGYKDQAYDLTTYQERVAEFCNSDWGTLQGRIAEHEWGTKINEAAAVDVCFKAAWIINLLHEGIGIPRVGLEAADPSKNDKTPKPAEGTKDVVEAAKEEGFIAPFQAVNKIDNTEVTWVLGKMILYAASQIPPSEARALDVGFGSNDPKLIGLPEDFEHGGSQPDGFVPDFDLKDYPAEADDDEGLVLEPSKEGLGEQWKDTLLSTANAAGRTPGYVLFGLIFVVVGILLCGRDRRANLYRKILSPLRGADPYRTSSDSTRRQGRSKLPFGLSFRREGTKYERLMEEGDAAGPLSDPQTFELANVSSSSSANHSSDDDAASLSSKSSGRRNNGRATPRRAGMSPFLEDGVGNGNLISQAVGLGLGPPGGEGQRSRTASPSRTRMGKQSVD